MVSVGGAETTGVAESLNDLLRRKDVVESKHWITLYWTIANGGYATYVRTVVCLDMGHQARPLARS